MSLSKPDGDDWQMCNVFSRDISDDLQINNNNIVDLKEQRTVLWTPLHSRNWKVELSNSWAKFTYVFAKPIVLILRNLPQKMAVLFQVQN